MYRVLEDFLLGWEYEVETTIKIFSSIPDELLFKQVLGYDRTLGRLSWHITTAIPHIALRIGLDVYQISPDSEPPKSAKEIVEEYKKASDSLLKQVKEKWTDNSLLEETDTFGEKWANGRTLAIIIGHQAHHRAQMTVLMRILGIKVPGVYGPSKEEWTQLGMEPQK